LFGSRCKLQTNAKHPRRCKPEGNLKIHPKCLILEGVRRRWAPSLEVLGKESQAKGQEGPSIEHRRR
jgi:hypothetical protein